jgi:MerR family transcriptional regulator/heat shock protein HspR
LIMKQGKLSNNIFWKDKKNMPLYPISIVADIIGTTEQTLRLYEKHNLIKPARRKKNRFYSENDIKWLQYLRDLLHNKKISIEGIKKLLIYLPCWEMTDCSKEKRNTCSAYIDKINPCWELNKMKCNRAANSVCEDCIVFLSKSVKKKNS